MEIIYRHADKNDIAQLAQNRWDFQLVGREEYQKTEQEYLKFCEKFLTEQFDSNSWIHFVAELEGEIISHVSLQIIENLPIPGRLENRWGYLTNAYTKPNFRRQGLCTNLVKNALDWADKNDLKKVILWPRETSIAIYKKFGFSQEGAVMERIIS